VVVVVVVMVVGTPILLIIDVNDDEWGEIEILNGEDHGIRELG
jgi:hypothetical protein